MYCRLEFSVFYIIHHAHNHNVQLCVLAWESVSLRSLDWLTNIYQKHFDKFEIGTCKHPPITVHFCSLTNLFTHIEWYSFVHSADLFDYRNGMNFIVFSSGWTPAGTYNKNNHGKSQPNIRSLNTFNSLVAKTFQRSLNVSSRRPVQIPSDRVWHFISCVCE